MTSTTTYTVTLTQDQLLMATLALEDRAVTLRELGMTDRAELCADTARLMWAAQPD